MSAGFNRAEFLTQFGRRLRQWRCARVMSQAELAHRSGYGPQHISDLERGHKPPTLFSTFVLAEVLEVHPRALLFGDEE